MLKSISLAFLLAIFANLGVADYLRSQPGHSPAWTSTESGYLPPNMHLTVTSSKRTANKLSLPELRDVVIVRRKIELAVECYEAVPIAVLSMASGLLLLAAADFRLF